MMVQIIGAILLSAIFLAFAIGGLYLQIKEEKKFREMLKDN